MGKGRVSDCHIVCGSGDGARIVFDVAGCRFESGWGAGGQDSIFLDPEFAVNDVVKGAVCESWDEG